MTRTPQNRAVRNAKVRKDAPAVLQETFGISGSALFLLRDIAATPLPVSGGPRKSPAGMGLRLGPLIRAGYAALDRSISAYVLTDKGTEFLARLKATGLFDEK